MMQIEVSGLVLIKPKRYSQFLAVRASKCYFTSSSNSMSKIYPAAFICPTMFLNVD